MAIEVVSHKGEFDRRFEKAVQKALRVVGGQGERLAKEKITEMGAVDTGFLRNSITFALAGKEANTQTYHDRKGEQTGSYSGTAPRDEQQGKHSVYIGTNVYYAPYVEYGTSKMVARPFLSQSITQNSRELEQLFKDAFDAFL